MMAELFKQIWTANGDKLSPLSLDSLDSLNLKPSTASFLSIAGLPAYASPYLSFVQNNTDMYNAINKLTNHYNFLTPEYDKYVAIGTCSNGDVIAINTNNNDQIVWLEHENEFTPHFFNSSIESLAECLLAYRKFVETILRENGEYAYLDCNFSDQQFEWLKQMLVAADSNVMTEAGFWRSELETMLAMRQSK